MIQTTQIKLDEVIKINIMNYKTTQTLSNFTNILEILTCGPKYSAELPKAGILGILDTEEHFPQPSRLSNILNNSRIVSCCAVIYRTIFLCNHYFLICNSSTPPRIFSFFCEKNEKHLEFSALARKLIRKTFSQFYLPTPKKKCSPKSFRQC